MQRQRRCPRQGWSCCCNCWGRPLCFADATKTFFTASKKSAANVRSNFCLIDSNRKKTREPRTLPQAKLLLSCCCCCCCCSLSCVVVCTMQVMSSTLLDSHSQFTVRFFLFRICNMCSAVRPHCVCVTKNYHTSKLQFRHSSICAVCPQFPLPSPPPQSPLC